MKVLAEITLAFMVLSVHWCEGNEEFLDGGDVADDELSGEGVDGLGDEGMEDFDMGDFDMNDMMGMGMDDMMGGGMPGMGMPGMGMPGMGMPEAEAVESDVKFVICDVCKALVEEAMRIVKELRAKLPNTKIGEARIDDTLSTICNSKEESGDWISRLDMVEDEDRIKLEKQPLVGRCMEECKTLELACEKVYSEIGVDLVEALFIDKKSLPELQDRFCTKGIQRKKGACGKAYPQIPEDRVEVGDNFIPKSEQELAMDEINRKMRASDLGSFGVKEL